MISRGTVRYLALTTVSVGAGATSVDLQPGAGKQWRVMYAVGYHADAAGARNCVWHCADPVGAGSLSPDVVLAATTEALALGAYAKNEASLCKAPLKATALRYYAFVFDASAVGQSGFIKAIVEEFGGMIDA